MDIISLIIILGIMQGFFLGILLLTKNAPNKKANRYFGLLYFIFSISIMDFVFIRTGVYFNYPHLMYTTGWSLYCFGPLLLFYVNALFDPAYTFRKTHLLHFVPLLTAGIISIKFYMLPAAIKLNLLTAVIQGKSSPWNIFMALSASFHVIIYMAVVHYKLTRYRHSLKDASSFTETIDLSFIYVAIYANYAIFTNIILVVILVLSHTLTNILTFIGVVPLMATVAIYVSGYMALRQREIPAEILDVARQPKMQRPVNTDPKAEQYIRQLQNLMESEKLFLDNQLTLKKLADRLGIPAYQLSQLINDRLNQNFFDFINSYRVNEAKRLLTDEEKSIYTVLAIGYESGFNSKSSFNSVFKKMTGVTPSDYRLSRDAAIQG